MTSPTKLTLAYLRRAGYRPRVTEHWNAHAGIRQDLYGYVDVIALGHGSVLFVQTTTAHNLTGRWRKITGKLQPADDKALGRALRLRDDVLAALDADVTIEVHGWQRHDRKRPLIRPVLPIDLVELLPVVPAAAELPF